MQEFKDSMYRFITCLSLSVCYLFLGVTVSKKGLSYWSICSGLFMILIFLLLIINEVRNELKRMIVVMATSSFFCLILYLVSSGTLFNLIYPF